LRTHPFFATRGNICHGDIKSVLFDSLETIFLTVVSLSNTDIQVDVHSLASTEIVKAV
jgi:hypothetical protein